MIFVMFKYIRDLMCTRHCSVQGICSPKQELMKPYHMQPVLPSSQRPHTLDAKLRLVPHTHTSMSLTLMFSRSMFTGVLSFLNLQKSTKTTKLFRKPKVIIKPKKTESAAKPAGESFGPGESPESAARDVCRSGSLMLKLEIYSVQLREHGFTKTNPGEKPGAALTHSLMRAVH